MQAGLQTKTVKPSGSLTVERASSLKAELAAALAGGDEVRIDLSSIEELDLACLQVLYAARSSAKAAGKALGLTGELREPVLRRLSSCGFLVGPAARPEDLDSALVDF